MTFDQIMTELKNKQYRPIYLLMGEEPYFIDVITDYIAEHVLREDEKAFNQSIIYGKESNVYAVLDAAKRYPMMSQYQVVIVKEAQQLKDFDKLQFYAEKPLGSTILVLNYKYKSLDKRLKLYKQLDSKNNAVFDSKKLYEEKVPAWISEYLSGRGYTIAPAASKLLTEYLGADLGKVVNELNKLIIVLSEKKERQITPDHIEKNVGISKEYNVFELQNALGAKDILKMNRIVQHFDRNPGDNPFVMVIASVFSYFVKILTYHYLPDKSQAASALRVHPYFVRQYEDAARRYPAGKVIQIIAILREYDLKSKGVGSLSASPGDLMREMFFKITH
jgi:DNA polymerase-3 subunit delta